MCVCLYTRARARSCVCVYFTILCMKMFVNFCMFCLLIYTICTWVFARCMLAFFKLYIALSLRERSIPLFLLLNYYFSPLQESSVVLL